MWLLILPALPTYAASYAWPLKQFAGLSSLFGDYRTFRYHAGVDLRTGGKEGWAVRAVADGYVMRASTSYFGYGKALYLRLNDGHIAVYGHLQSFGPGVTAKVRAEQRRLKRYKTDLSFQSDEIRVQKGAVIARSGQTGAGAPHLHFELRTGDNHPLNPLTHGFRSPDSRAPVIEGIWVVPQYLGGEIGYGPAGVEPVRLRLLDGKLLAPAGPESKIHLSGPIGFAIEAHDRKSGSEFRYTPYAFRVIVAGATVFQSRLDTLDYETMSQSPLERSLWLDTGGNAYNLYKAVGNQLGHSRADGPNPGGFVFARPGDSSVPFQIEVIDEGGNRSIVRGEYTFAKPLVARPEGWGETFRTRAAYVEYQPDDSLALSIRQQVLASGAGQQRWKTLPGLPRFHRLYAADCELGTRFHLNLSPNSSPVEFALLSPEAAAEVFTQDSSVSVTAPEGSVYEPAWLSVSSLVDSSGRQIWEVGPSDLTLKSALKVSAPAPADSTLSVWALDMETKKLSFVAADRSDDRLAWTLRRSGRYTLARDTIAPRIQNVRPRDGARISPRATITASISDDMAGIGEEAITVLLDGEWLVPEYDPETRALKAAPWGTLKTGSHTLTIRAQDEAGNARETSHRFRVVK
jgi:hypothetical protein